MKKLSLLITVALLLAALTACTSAEPEVIIETVEVEVPVEVEVEVEVPAEAVDKIVVEFWTTDNEEGRIDVYEAIAVAFMAEHPEIDLRIIPIEESG
ncbi:MAG: hypothetical protein GQ562_07405, partial [Anaerolineales bacterium]|nr:hypothetical protein [Anaerolineales bacterium]